jgi:ribonuclease HII
LGDDFPQEILGDSKKLRPDTREKARLLICSGALAWGIGWASAAEIDDINILRASLLAMKRAFLEMAALDVYKSLAPPLLAGGSLCAVVDGLFVPDIPIPARALVKADAKVPEVMAASILAKTARDNVMLRYAWLYPEYGYDRHKGYPTKAHKEAIAAYGPSPIQRMTFKAT